MTLTINSMYQLMVSITDAVQKFQCTQISYKLSANVQQIPGIKDRMKLNKNFVY